MEEDIKILKEKIEFWKNDPRIMIQEENYKILQVIENILIERQADKERIKDSIPKAKIIEEKGARKHIMKEYKKKWIHKDEKYYKTEIEFNLLEELLKDGGE